MFLHSDELERGKEVEFGGFRAIEDEISRNPYFSDVLPHCTTVFLTHPPEKSLRSQSDCDRGLKPVKQLQNGKPLCLHDPNAPQKS